MARGEHARTSLPSSILGPFIFSAHFLHTDRPATSRDSRTDSPRLVRIHGESFILVSIAEPNSTITRGARLTKGAPSRMAYDFTTLSPDDFEELTSDLLSRDWGVRLESFKRGKDKGIDLRNVRVFAGSGVTVVQCKRYAPHRFAELLRAVIAEKAKIDKLRPEAAASVFVEGDGGSGFSKQCMVEVQNFLGPAFGVTRDALLELSSPRRPSVTDFVAVCRVLLAHNLLVPCVVPTVERLSALHADCFELCLPLPPTNDGVHVEWIKL